MENQNVNKCPVCDKKLFKSTGFRKVNEITTKIVYYFCTDCGFSHNSNTEEVKPQSTNN